MSSLALDQVIPSMSAFESSNLLVHLQADKFEATVTASPLPGPALAVLESPVQPLLLASLPGLAWRLRRGRRVECAWTPIRLRETVAGGLGSRPRPDIHLRPGKSGVEPEDAVRERRSRVIVASRTFAFGRSLPRFIAQALVRPGGPYDRTLCVLPSSNTGKPAGDGPLERLILEGPCGERFLHCSHRFQC